MTQVSARSYTIDEIDRLRSAINSDHWLGHDHWSVKELNDSVESQLRTALIANVDPNQAIADYKLKAEKFYERNPRGY